MTQNESARPQITVEIKNPVEVRKDKSSQTAEKWSQSSS